MKSVLKPPSATTAIGTAAARVLPVIAVCSMGMTACRDDGATDACPDDSRPPSTIYEADLYEGGGTYDEPNNLLEYFHVNVRARDEDTAVLSAGAFLKPEYTEPQTGENVICLSSSTFPFGLWGLGGSRRDDGIVYSGYAIVDMIHLSADPGCGTVRFQDLLFGAQMLDYALRLTADGELACQGDDTPD